MTSLFQATDVMPHPISFLMADHILGRKVSLFLDTNLTKTFACGLHFQFHSNDLFEKVNWN